MTMPRTSPLSDMDEFRRWTREVLRRHIDQLPLGNHDTYALGLIQGLCASTSWDRLRERIMIVIEELDLATGRTLEPTHPPAAVVVPHPDHPCRPLANSTCPGCRDAWRRELGIGARKAS